MTARQSSFVASTGCGLTAQVAGCRNRRTESISIIRMVPAARSVRLTSPSHPLARPWVPNARPERPASKPDRNAPSSARRWQSESRSNGADNSQYHGQPNMTKKGPSFLRIASNFEFPPEAAIRPHLRDQPSPFNRPDDVILAFCMDGFKDLPDFRTIPAARIARLLGDRLGSLLPPCMSLWPISGEEA